MIVAIAVGCIATRSARAVAPATPAGSAAPVVVGAAPVVVGAAPDLPLFTAVDGPLAPDTQLKLSVTLEPQDAAGLANYATAVSTPGSGLFGQFLTVPQFAARFGASSTAVATVSDDLRSAGLTVGPVTANGLLLPVSGTAAQIDSALDIALEQVTLPQGRTTYVNLTAPSVPAGAAPYIQGVIGLDDLTPPQPAGLQGASASATATPGTLAADAAGSSPSAAASRAVSPRLASGGPQPNSTCRSQMQTDGVNVSGSFPGAYTFDEQAADYGFSSFYSAGDLGAGQTVALVEFGGYNTSDISAFQSCYGTSATVTPVNVDGGPPSGEVADGEAALDIETIIGLAPKATVDVYQAPTTDNSQVDLLNAIAAANTAKVVSDSNGLCEPVINGIGASIMSSENTTLEEMASQGQTFLASSGDSGSAQCSQDGEGSAGWTTKPAVIDPASQPFATGVGGTTMFTVTTPASGSTQGSLALDTTGAAPTEAVWNEGVNSECDCADSPQYNGGSGGGISTHWTMPGYQSGAAGSLGIVGPDSAGASFCGSATCREVPDVSADADTASGYAIYETSKAGNSLQSGWAPIGGTSASAPLWAAFAALTDASSACQDKDVGFLNPALYTIASANYSANFNDVKEIASLETTSGGTTSANQPLNNDTFADGDELASGVSDQANGMYPVATGYDMATGLGSMIAPALSASLCKLAVAPPTVTVTNPGSQSATVGAAYALQISGSDSAGEAVSYTASGLPAGLSMNSSGAISGTPTAAGTVTVTVTGTDTPSRASGSTSFPISVAAPAPAAQAPTPATPAPTVKPAPTATPQTVGAPSVTHAALSGVRSRAAKLSFTVIRGTNAPDIKTLVIGLPTGLTFNLSAQALKRGVKVSAGRGSLRIAHGQLTIAFATPLAQVSVTLTSGLIKTSAADARGARKKRPATVALTVRVEDAGGTSTLKRVNVKL